MFLANFIFIVSQLKIYSDVHLITAKALSHCSQEDKFIIFRYSYVLTRV